MTREEELYEQSKKYLHDAMQDDDFGASGDLDEIKEAFKSGARWADSHPVIPWRSVKEELPKDYEWVVACVDKNDDNSLIMLDYRMPNNKWGLHNELEYTHFMPIPELPKEKEEQK